MRSGARSWKLQRPHFALGVALVAGCFAGCAPSVESLSYAGREEANLIISSACTELKMELDKIGKRSPCDPSCGMKSNWRERTFAGSTCDFRGYSWSCLQFDGSTFGAGVILGALREESSELQDSTKPAVPLKKTRLMGVTFEAGAKLEGVKASSKNKISVCGFYLFVRSVRHDRVVPCWPSGASLQSYSFHFSV